MHGVRKKNGWEIKRDGRRGGGRKISVKKKGYTPDPSSENVTPGRSSCVSDVITFWGMGRGRRFDGMETIVVANVMRMRRGKRQYRRAAGGGRGSFPVEAPG